MGIVQRGVVVHGGEELLLAVDELGVDALVVEGGVAVLGGAGGRVVAPLQCVLRQLKQKTSL